MDAPDIALRNATYIRFVELGRAPSPADVATVTGLSESAVRRGWRRLHAAHALVLDERGQIQMANPFAGQPTAFRVDADGKQWFANCAWEAFGIGAALRTDSTVHAECADCGAALDIHVREATASDTDLVFHVLVPAASWWDDIGYT